MKFLLANISIVSALLLAGPTSAQDDGPFGVTMGSDPANYGCIEDEPRGYYRCATLPRSHPDMEFYSLKAEPGIGVCFIKGLGKNIPSNGFGGALGVKVDEIARQVESTYGSSRLVDYLVSGSTWDESQDWMMGIFEEERIYAYHWSEGAGATLRNGVAEVFVIAKALTPDVGYVAVEFHFSNKQECDEAAAKRGASAF